MRAIFALAAILALASCGNGLGAKVVRTAVKTAVF